MRIIKVGDKVIISGRFIPENHMEDVTKNNISFSYPLLIL